MSKGRGQRGIRRISENTDWEQEFAGVTGEATHAEAVLEIDSRPGNRRLPPGQRGLLEQLAHKVTDHEAAHSPIPFVSPAQMLHFLITDGKQTTPKAVADDTGIDLDTLCDYLKDARPMSRPHKQTLARYFNVKPSVFDSGKRA